MALVVPVPGRHPERLRAIGVDRQLMGVPGTTLHPVAPALPAIRGRDQRPRLDSDPEPVRILGMTADPTDVMRLRTRWERPRGRRLQSVQSRPQPPAFAAVLRGPHGARLRSRPEQALLRRARDDDHDPTPLEARHPPRRAAVLAPPHAGVPGPGPRTARLPRVPGHRCGPGPEPLRRVHRPRARIDTMDRPVVGDQDPADPAVGRGVPAVGVRYRAHRSPRSA